MSVFTPLTPAQIQPWLKAQGITELINMRGIAAGTVNTNYWLTTNVGEWILTLVEDRPAAAVTPVMELMAALADAGLKVPGVQRSLNGDVVTELANKPATLVTALPGRQPDIDQDSCAQMGAFLGQLHQQCLDIAPIPMNFGPAWQADRMAHWRQRLPSEKTQHLDISWARIQPLWQQELPMAWTHGDLFPDNALYADGQLSTVIDWYFASWAPCLWDLAVAVNAWCGARAEHDPLVVAVLSGYGQQRALTAAEQAAFPRMREAAALRFWLSRLDAAALAQQSSEITVKSPDEQENMLLDLQHLHG
ncbi:homoserine kinase [Salinispirillum marinum]|uniref:Homoserine kinase n=2 Tax=Saccharospirillaceae TaxID=255527 RepID=A0ABV8BBQ3_9GAMM